MSEGEIDSVPAYAGNVGMTAEIQLCKQLRSFWLRNVADHHIAGEPVVDSEYVTVYDRLAAKVYSRELNKRHIAVEHILADIVEHITAAQDREGFVFFGKSGHSVAEAEPSLNCRKLYRLIAREIIPVRGI